MCESPVSIHSTNSRVTKSVYIPEDIVVQKNFVTRMRLDENVQKVQELLDQNVPVREIGRRLDCDYKTIRDLIKFKGLRTGELKPGAPRSSHAYTPENVEKILILRKSGYGLGPISRIMKCSVLTVKNVLSENIITTQKEDIESKDEGK